MILFGAKGKKSAYFYFLGITALFLILEFNNLTPALAIEYGGFGGRPAYPRPDEHRTESIFIHTLKPGAVQKEGVIVVNNTPEKKTLMVYAADSTPSTGGAFACKQFSETNQDVGSWITLDKSEITLDPNTKELIPFKIKVPANASVGEHNGCILIQEKKIKTQGQAGVNLSIRTGLRVAITIPGEISRQLEIIGLKIEKQKTGGWRLIPRIKNSGNVSIDTDVKVETRYFFGLWLARHGGQYPLLRGETSDWNFELKKPFWGGWYRVSLSAAYNTNPTTVIGVKDSANLTTLKSPAMWFFSFPRLLGLAIEILILSLFLAAAFLLRRARRQNQWIKSHWVEYEVQAGEDINLLAQNFNISWKLLAKVNKLKPPYALRQGDKIQISPNKQ